MVNEYIFDLENHSISEIIKKIKESQEHIPGLVFNYPPISVWDISLKTSLEPKEVWADSNVYSTNLYIHIPFCRQKCSFCYYSVAVIKDDTQAIWDYLHCLEIEALSYLPSFKDKKIETVFIGGGTPSRLNVEQMEFLFTRIIRRFDLTNCREITYECSPDSVTKDTLNAMKSFGVSRLSMGVQTFDETILEKTRRGDNKETIIGQYQLMVDSGVPNINIDLIAGVELEEHKHMAYTMDAIQNMKKKPTQVTLFTLSVREGAIDFATLKGRSHYEIYKNSLALYIYARKRLMENGYWQYSKNLLPSKDWIFHYQDNIWGNNGYVLALGASGYSHSQNFTYANEFDYKTYMQKIKEGKSSIQKIFPLSDEESVHRHIVLAMKHTELDKHKFNSFYENENVLRKYDPIFEAMEQLDLIKNSNDKLRYTEDGIHSVDRYVRLFFSPIVNNKILQKFSGTVGSKKDSFNFTV